MKATEYSEIWSYFTCPICLCLSLQEWPPSWPWPHSVSAPGTLSLKWPMPQLWTGSLLSAMPLSSRPSLSLPQSTTSPRGVTPGTEKVWCRRRYLKPPFYMTYILKNRHVKIGIKYNSFDLLLFCYVIIWHMTALISPISSAAITDLVPRANVEISPDKIGANPFVQESKDSWADQTPVNIFASVLLKKVARTVST